MFSRLRELVLRRDAGGDTDVTLAPPRPVEPFYAIGDIHGRVDLLSDMVTRVEHDLDAQGLESAKVVFVGDLVDRGEHSDQVLAQVYRLARGLPEKVICLMGNHERMMLDFLERPAEKGARWLRNGGLQTLASFKVAGHVGAAPEALEDIAAALRERIPPEHLAWLQELPLSWSSGNVVCVHAALDPALPLEVQKSTTLLWGHRDFLAKTRTDGLWVVHGHTITDAPSVEKSRISIDTGAYYSGKLTVAAIFPDRPVRFL